MIAIAISNPFLITDDCDNILLSYGGSVPQYEFNYTGSNDQQVRVGAFLRTDKPDKKEKITRLSNGVYRRGNTFIDKSIEFHSDLVDEETREAITTALHHTNVIIDGKSYFCYGTVNYEDNEFNNLANVTATLYEQGYNQTNMQC